MAAPTHAEILENFRRLHEAGDETAARCALEWCAADRLVMPDWLRTVVLKEVRRAESGRDDALMGGTRADRRRAYLRGRDWAIRRIDEALAHHSSQKTGVTKAHLIEATAKLHKISVKAVEKILYRPLHKKPTSTRRK